VFVFVFVFIDTFLADGSSTYLADFMI
jgi:hypothetical protein